jgi:hypothetical protein
MPEENLVEFLVSSPSDACPLDNLEKAFNTFHLNLDDEDKPGHCEDVSVSGDDMRMGVRFDSGSHSAVTAISQFLLPDPAPSSHVSVLVHSIPDTLKDRILLQIHGPHGTPAHGAAAIQLVPAFEIITDFPVTLADEQRGSLCTDRGFSCISDDPEDGTDLTVCHTFVLPNALLLLI